MTVLAGVLMVVAVAAIVARPLARRQEEQEEGRAASERVEVLEREKNAALLAIKEASFDRAMGKLSEEDYMSLRGFYEERALGALSELDRMDDSATGAVTHDRSAVGAAGGRDAAFCSACGLRFDSGDRYCPGCGAPRRQL